MLEAALDNVHAALMGFAVQHDALFSLLLVAPAAVACFFAYFIVRYHGYRRLIYEPRSLYLRVPTSGS